MKWVLETNNYAVETYVYSSVHNKNEWEGKKTDVQTAHGGMCLADNAAFPRGSPVHGLVGKPSA